jgi:hypothetical protein
MKSRMCIRRRLFAALACVLAAPASAQQRLTYDLAPYDLCKANWSSANYLQALFSPRWKAVAFAQDCFGDRDGLGAIYFVDDMGRVIRSFVEEAEHGPVARVEAVAAMARGLLAAAVPGSSGRSFFVIDGRKAIYLAPEKGDLGLFWLQDTSTPMCKLRVELRRAGGDWTPVRFDDAPRPPEASTAETVLAARASGAEVTVHSFSGVLDRAPFVRVRSAEPVDVRVVATDLGGPRTLRIGAKPALEARPAGLSDAPAAEGYALLQVDSKRDNAASDKKGWERADLWNALDSMLMLACKPRTARLSGDADERAWRRVSAAWTGVREAELYVSPFLEVDPAHAGYVTAAAKSVAATGRYGLKPYLPVRTSNGFYGGVVGLASAADLLVRYKHPLASRVKAAALEAFGAVLDAEKRGYHGVYEYNLIDAARSLRRIAPKAFEYDAWVRKWADRDLARCPEGWAAPPWSDTALRAVRGWHTAWLITGDQRYRDAVSRAMAQFDLPAEKPYDAFVWKEGRNVWNGYGCTGAAMLLGQWAQLRDPRAERMVSGAGKGFMSDFGFVPYLTWTCDDLLPYYVGYSLPAVFGPSGYPGPRKRLGLQDFVAYDAAGNVRKVAPPPFAPGPQ